MITRTELTQVTGAIEVALRETLLATLARSANEPTHSAEMRKALTDYLLNMAGDERIAGLLGVRQYLRGELIRFGGGIRNE